SPWSLFFFLVYLKPFSQTFAERVSGRRHYTVSRRQNQAFLAFASANSADFSRQERNRAAEISSRRRDLSF
ncbi:MAG: hypothetical protein IJE77_14425, partial [Thermoguttaceae bacterium]|nr:hypothetical protein [Thermoguttaceae bacterium]